MNDLQVLHGVNAVLDVRDVGVVKRAAHVEHAVDGGDVGQEGVAQALAVGCAPAGIFVVGGRTWARQLGAQRRVRADPGQLPLPLTPHSLT